MYDSMLVDGVDVGVWMVNNLDQKLPIYDLYQTFLLGARAWVQSFKVSFFSFFREFSRLGRAREGAVSAPLLTVPGAVPAYHILSVSHGLHCQLQWCLMAWACLFMSLRM